MTEFTSLVCPNCGGALKAAAYARTLRCPYCGTEHVLSGAEGEIAFVPDGAVCPVCGKSDRVGSLSMILAHPAEGERATGLPKRLTLLPPQYYPAVELERGSATGKVKMPGDDLFWVSLGLIGIYFVYWYLDIFVVRPESTITGLFWSCFVTGLCFVGIGGWFLWFSVFFSSADRQMRQAEVNRQRQLAREYPQALKRYKWELAQNKKIEQAYQAAREVWGRLYYCGRDDCLYLPGEEAHARPEQMVEFVKQHL